MDCLGNGLRSLGRRKRLCSRSVEAAIGVEQKMLRLGG